MAFHFKKYSKNALHMLYHLLINKQNYYLRFERVCSINVPLVLTWFRHFRVNPFELEFPLEICISIEIEAGIIFAAAVTVLDKRASIQAVNFICSMQKFTLSM